MSNFQRKVGSAKTPSGGKPSKVDSPWSAHAETPKPARRAKSVSTFAKRVSKKELANLTSQMAIMTKSGVDVASAIQSLVRQSKHPTLKTILEEVHENVLGGNSFSDSLGQYPSFFSATFIASVAAGEASGKL